MYILKQVFFSISVNSGVINLFILCSVYIFSHYSPRFQRIIVNCTSQPRNDGFEKLNKFTLLTHNIEAWNLKNLYKYVI